MTLQKTYQYKIFNPSGVYQGLLQNVVSDFQYNHVIGSAAVQIAITVAQNEPGSLIVNDNLIQVVETSQYYPNGLVVFNGYISKWKNVYGGSEEMTVTCISNGQDLPNYLIQSGDSTSITQETDTGTTFNLGDNSLPDNDHWVIQTFTVASTLLIGGVSVELTTVEANTLTISLFQQVGANPDPGSDTLIASGQISIPGAITKLPTKVTFNSPTTLATSTNYYFIVGWSGNSYAQVYASTSNPFAGGTIWTDIFAGTSWAGASQVSGDDLWFIIWEHGGGTQAAYSSQDLAFMLSDVITNYNSLGGLMTPPAGNVFPPLIAVPYNDANAPSAFWAAAFAQAFTPSANMSINLVQLWLGSLSGGQTMAVNIYKGNPALDTVNVIAGSESYTLGSGNTFVASSNTLNVKTAGGGGAQTFSFNSPVALTAGTQYYVLIQFGQGEMGNVVFKGASSTDLPISIAQVGTAYYGLCTVNNESQGMAYSTTFPAFYLNLGLVTPLPTILQPGYVNTGIVESYTFKVQTILDAINAIQSMAPSDWYWYGDPATNVLYFQEASATADLTIVKGRHINSFEVEVTRENIKNVGYFTGGDDGTGTSTNIFVKRTLPQSGHRVGLLQLSDNRVSGTGGATVGAQIITAALNQAAGETYVSTIIIQDGTCDTNLFKLGKMLGFNGFGDAADTLLLQIIGLQKLPDQVVLSLGTTLPVRPTKLIARIQAQLTSVQTVNNPNTPS